MQNDFVLLLHDLVADDFLLPTSTDPIPPGRHVDMGNGDVAYIREFPGGDDGAEPVLFLPGLGAPSLSWADVGGLLSPHFDGQALDLPGFGRTKTSSGYSIQAHAEFVARWIEFSNRGPVHLCGNSMGGLIALRVAMIRPDLIRSLTVLSPATPTLNSKNLAHWVAGLAMPWAARMRRRRYSTFDDAQAHEWFRQYMQRHCVDVTRLTALRVREGASEVQFCFRAPEFMDAFLETIRSAARIMVRSFLPGTESLWRVCRQINVPTLILWGRHDHVFPVPLASKLARSIPGSQLHIIDDAGHAPHVELPRVVARAFATAHARINSPLWIV